MDAHEPFDRVPETAKWNDKSGAALPSRCNKAAIDSKSNGQTSRRKFSLLLPFFII